MSIYITYIYGILDRYNMNTTTIQNNPEEVAIFLITKLLQKEQFISKDTVFQGLRNVGVPEDVIASAWYTAVTETDV